jgi:hypothetical protein
MPTDDPSDYVSQHRGQLIDIIRHSNDTFTRSLCVAALVEYGDDPSVDAIIDDLRDMDNSNNDD